MSGISAALVKDLRGRTGAGMMDCKRALQATAGDIDAAVEKMRIEGQAKADKKAGRVAAEGMIAFAGSAQAVALVEVNCETDFVAKGDAFTGFAQRVADQVLVQRPADVDALLALEVDGETLDTQRRTLVAKLGENIAVRRFDVVEAAGGALGHYLHGSRIGVVVALSNGDDALAKDLSMHVAASRPRFIDESEVPADVLATERKVIAAQSEEQSAGKPPEIVAKMIEGRLRKFLGEVTLVGQPFVKDPDQKVGKLLKGAGASVARFARFEVGEGIEKQQGDFAEEVMAQAKASMA